MVVNTVTEAKARLSELIARVQAGEEVIIGKAGQPAAVLRSYQSSSPRRRPGSMRGKIRIAPDFDDLPEDLADAFGVRCNVPAELAEALVAEKTLRGISLNATVIDLLRRALGVAPDTSYGNGLGRHAGDWSEADLQEFEANTAMFQKVDEELWR